jgi:CRP-like cAMP-binding protein
MKQAHTLYETLFDLNPLPQELKLKANRNALMLFLDARISTSHHTHRQLLLSAGQIADHVYFVVSGIVRAYTDDEARKKEHTVSLWENGDIITEPNSFFKRLPSEMYIEVIPESKLISLSREQLAEVFKAFPYTEKFSRCLTLQYVSYHTKRTRDLISRSAWERYLDLLNKHPKIETKISKEIIASYLGIAPQSLSRLIKKNGHP